ncbi:hypothetical protein [Deinococcus sp. Leaf326]|uniref:hypothetical protein n=1 Tax=Deinococcus sp. Leaf326 TaxID=1736338 RepID=UPI0006FCFA6D|nr:hypothetical protein [Deinococcus sp. Leaf326]KQR33112.1 hypothetical protein ASF71_16610 [Deinococcus sp. Leaf326]
MLNWFSLDARLDRALRRYNEACEITEYDEIPQEAHAAYAAALSARTPDEKRQALRELRYQTWDLSAYPYI